VLFYEGGNCGCFVLINKWCWVQSALCAIRLFMQSESDGENNITGKIKQEPNGPLFLLKLFVKILCAKVGKVSNSHLAFFAIRHFSRFIRNCHAAGCQCDHIGLFWKVLGANFLLIKVTLVIFTWAVPFLSQRSNLDWTNPNYYLLPWIRLSRDNELYFWLNFPDQKIIFRFVDDLPLRIRAFLRPTRHCSMRILLRTLIRLKPEFWGMN